MVLGLSTDAPSKPSLFFWPTCLWLWMALMSLCMFGCKAHECWHVQVCGPLCWRGGHFVHFINGECVRECIVAWMSVV